MNEARKAARAEWTERFRTLGLSEEEMRNELFDEIEVLVAENDDLKNQSAGLKAKRECAPLGSRTFEEAIAELRDELGRLHRIEAAALLVVQEMDRFIDDDGALSGAKAGLREALGLNSPPAAVIPITAGDWAEPTFATHAPKGAEEGA